MDGADSGPLSVKSCGSRASYSRIFPLAVSYRMNTQVTGSDAPSSYRMSAGGDLTISPARGAGSGSLTGNRMPRATRLLSSLAASLNDLEAAGIRVQFAHGAVITDYGFVFGNPDDLLGRVRWESRDKVPHSGGFPLSGSGEDED